MSTNDLANLACTEQYCERTGCDPTSRISDRSETLSVIRTVRWYNRSQRSYRSAAYCWLRGHPGLPDAARRALSVFHKEGRARKFVHQCMHASFAPPTLGRSKAFPACGQTLPITLFHSRAMRAALSRVPPDLVQRSPSPAKPLFSRPVRAHICTVEAPHCCPISRGL